jgi:hypothetical protein
MPIVRGEGTADSRPLADQVLAFLARFPDLAFMPSEIVWAVEGRKKLSFGEGALRFVERLTSSSTSANPVKEYEVADILKKLQLEEKVVALVCADVTFYGVSRGGPQH